MFSPKTMQEIGMGLSFQIGDRVKFSARKGENCTYAMSHDRLHGEGTVVQVYCGGMLRIALDGRDPERTVCVIPYGRTFTKL